MLFVAGTAWKHLAALVALGVAALTVVLIAAPGRAFTAQALPGGPPDSLPGPWRDRAKRTLPAAGVEDRDRRRRQDRPRRQRNPHAANFVPVNSTDFIFAAVGERYGFAGASFVPLFSR